MACSSPSSLNSPLQPDRLILRQRKFFPMYSQSRGDFTIGSSRHDILSRTSGNRLVPWSPMAVRTFFRNPVFVAAMADALMSPIALPARV
ncbi:hypothetical protein HNQ81_003445 [Desulfoprunum benzoelyticum]|uniref:Uncharacterized protein n=1 Tax=Desulfoprunum benzoelyticum TaxID=1506996 RepID=A0A840V4G9_9BACT|nr:hypothetical protein [Desulfoprunum benzoelyticum]